MVLILLLLDQEVFLWVGQVFPWYLLEAILSSMWTLIFMTTKMAKPDGLQDFIGTLMNGI